MTTNTSPHFPSARLRSEQAEEEGARATGRPRRAGSLIHSAGVCGAPTGVQVLGARGLTLEERTPVGGSAYTCPRASSKAVSCSSTRRSRQRLLELIPACEFCRKKGDVYSSRKLPAPPGGPVTGTEERTPAACAAQGELTSVLRLPKGGPPGRLHGTALTAALCLPAHACPSVSRHLETAATTIRMERWDGHGPLQGTPSRSRAPKAGNTFAL